MIRLLDRISYGLNAIGIWMIFLMMLMICTAVIARYFFRTSIPGSIESVQLMQVIAVGLGLGYAQREKANINVDLFVTKLPQRWQHLIGAFNAVAATLVFAFVSYGIFKISSTKGAMRETTDTLGLPLYPFKWLLAAGFAILALQIVTDLLRELSALRKGAAGTDRDGTRTSSGPRIEEHV